MKAIVNVFGMYDVCLSEDTETALANWHLMVGEVVGLVVGDVVGSIVGWVVGEVVGLIVGEIVGS